LPAGISRASSEENVSSTLSAGITDVAVTMDVGDASKLQSPCYLVIDRVDAAGTLKATSLWEYVKVTNIATNTLTITRAQGGSTGQAHSSGAVVEAVMTAALQEEYYAAFNPEHTATGGHIMSTATIAYLENVRMAVSSVASISSLKTDTFTSINLGASSLASLAQVAYKATKPTLTADSDGATITFDMNASNIHTVTLGGNRTLAVSNVGVGQFFTLRLLQDGTGSRTVTWFATIKWAGGSAPTLTTTASKADNFGFVCTSAGNYDGYTVGANI